MQEAHVQNIHSTTNRVAALAAIGISLLAGAVPAAYAQAAEKKWKSQAEYDLYNAIGKDFAAQNFTKALTDLDAWKQQTPDSDYKNQRELMYVQAYNSSKQPGKALDAGAPLLANMDTLYPDAKDQLNLLYTLTIAVQQAAQQQPEPTPAQVATGEKAARALLNFNKKPEGTSDADWNNAKAQLQNAAKAGVLIATVLPGNQALAKNDCETAQQVYSKALSESPENSFISYQLGRAWLCTAKKDPGKVDEVYPKAIYQWVRAMATDPTLGGTQDAKKMTESITRAYTNYHGDEEGLEQLKATVKSSPLPPSGFTLESSTAASARKQKEFSEKYPELALWLGIKGQLAGPGGEQYFATSMKDADVPKLKGTVLEGRPACRSKEILVSVPEPNQQGSAPAVITLKLDSALTGKPEPGEILFKGVPTAFKPDPFMLTMDTEKAKIEGLKTSACAAAAPRPGAKKGAPSKKK
jgi:hypothetical protein